MFFRGILNKAMLRWILSLLFTRSKLDILIYLLCHGILFLSVRPKRYFLILTPTVFMTHKPNQHHYESWLLGVYYRCSVFCTPPRCQISVVKNCLKLHIPIFEAPRGGRTGLPAQSSLWRNKDQFSF